MKWLFALALTATTFALGCGNQEDTRTTGQVQGKVTFKGQPVPFGTVTFSPVPKDDKDKEPGKAATGQVETDGSFHLNTYIEKDGAVVGKHKVSIGSPDPARKLPGKSPDDLIVEVKPGDNPVEIQLVR
ncbi:hypothetical protein [Planctomyces sp. SH-PL14]|uniref:hypothetical protein n=1 Tax=Planctomyces sp. SH-PL14 TaxID=1632864 RepID=UPI00078BB261|nr:hypothetical protein [Planctomyces sp. SH-PL14]AMV18004.1 hypothetical protein VT03_08950 [Planctomyces sp. SH-PL14]